MLTCKRRGVKSSVMTSQRDVDAAKPQTTRAAVTSVEHPRQTKRRTAWRWLLAAALAVSVGMAVAYGLRLSGSASVEPIGSDVVVHSFAIDSTNAHLVVGPRGMFLFDAGLQHNAEQLESAIRDAGLDPARLRAVIISHGHADHAGGAKHFQRKFGTPVIAGHADAALFETGRNDTLCPTNAMARLRHDDDQAASYEPLRPDVLVDARRDLEPLTGIAGELWPAPGHTPGSLLVKVGSAVFVGDLFRGAIVGDSAEVHFYMCDLAQNQRQLRQLLQSDASAATRFFTGHFGPVSRARVVQLAESSFAP